MIGVWPCTVQAAPASPVVAWALFLGRLATPTTRRGHWSAGSRALARSDIFHGCLREAQSKQCLRQSRWADARSPEAGPRRLRRDAGARHCAECGVIVSERCTCAALTPATAASHKFPSKVILVALLKSFSAILCSIVAAIKRRHRLFDSAETWADLFQSIRSAAPAAAVLKARRGTGANL